MKSIKCPECRLTNWATAAGCQRCGFLFQNGEPENQPAQHFEEQPVPGWNQYPENQSSSSQNYDRRGGWSPNQNYEQKNYQNYQQPNHGYNQSADLKTGLAIASMILGILGFVTSIFLIGILLSPIGLILGIVALIKANKKPHIYGGKGFAIAGIATSALMVLFVPIIAAIAIPNLMAARRSANEGSAISTLRTLAGAEQTFMAVKATDRCGDLPALVSQNLINADLAKGEKNGYRFMVVNAPTVNGGCELHAAPLSSSTGTRSFYFSTGEGVIRAANKNGKLADQNDAMLNSDSFDYSERPPKIATR